MTQAEEAALHVRYAAAVHKVQTGVALDISVSGANGAGADPKHLRTGINSAMADAGALASLLIAKGVFTGGEYLTAIVAAAEREAASMEQRVRDRFRADNITLG